MRREDVRVSLLLILWCVIGAVFLFSFFCVKCVSVPFFSFLIVGGGGFCLCAAFVCLLLI